jgi:hypothetical protein
VHPDDCSEYSEYVPPLSRVSRERMPGTPSQPRKDLADRLRGFVKDANERDRMSFIALAQEIGGYSPQGLNKFVNGHTPVMAKLRLIEGWLVRTGRLRPSAVLPSTKAIARGTGLDAERFVLGAAERLLFTLSHAVVNRHMQLKDATEAAEAIAPGMLPEAEDMVSLWVAMTREGGRRYVETWLEGHPK